MPAYNAGKYIETAIRSVMAQSYGDWELLVLDDGSTDDTCVIAEGLAEEDPRIRFVRNQENLGAAAARNRGFDLARGDYIALLDSDDVWHPQKLEKQLERMKATGADFSYSSYAMIDSAGSRAGRDYLVPERLSFQMLLRENVVGCSTVMLRRSLTDRYRFTTEFYHEDYVMWLQLLQDGYKACGCTEVLAQWRYAENSRSFHKGKSAGNRWRIYREYLKLPFWKSAVLFAGYVAAGLKKYLS